MNPDFVALLRELNAAEARYLIVGAYALAQYARPRATGDLGLWVEPTAGNAARVHTALAAFGAPLEQLSVEELHQPDLVFQIGLPPRRIDLLTSLTALDFEPCWSESTESHLGDVPCRVLGREALIRNKRAVGRPRDLADIADLEG